MTHNSTPTTSRSKVAARLGLCAAALVGSLMAPAAHAAIVTFSTPISVPSNFDGIYLNLLTGAQGTSGASTPGWDINPYNSGAALSFFWNQSSTPAAGGVAGTTTGPYLDLTVGSVISAASTFTAVTAAVQTAAFQVPGNHILGFRFFNESTSSINYGYMSLTSQGSNGFPLTINGWSFDTSGAAITVVPEPATALMLSMGALGLGAFHLRRTRRERRQTAA